MTYCWNKYNVNYDYDLAQFAMSSNCTGQQPKWILIVSVLSTYFDTADSKSDNGLAPSGPVSYRDHYVSYRRTLCGVQYTLAKFQWNSPDYYVKEYFACPNNAAQDNTRVCIETDIQQMEVDEEC